ncbi:unnamed protein product [Lactuca saligna]|uniref:La-related protein 6B n=1 Tax=Lactuca saligna TaxID=75948 RepID=A0AA35VSZ5_LACSI|nr:unnamed protein product [Lactuca saligna]
MAQEPPSSSQTLESVIHHDDLQQSASTVTSSSSDTNNPTLTRNVSSSRLNAKAPEFVPRTTTAASSPSSSSTTTSTTVTTRADLSQPRLVISPPPTSPGIIHYHHHQHHNHTHNHNHPRPFNGATGFLDHKDVSVQAQRTVHGDPDSKDGLTDEATQKILNQVEYYFSDINLATTDHLMRFINKDPEGYVPISVVVSFKKIKALVNSNSQLASILRNSTKLMVSEDGKKVKRQHPLTESDMEELQSRIIVAENLPEDHCHQNLMKVFSVVGSVKTIRTCQPQASNGGPSSNSRTAKADGMLFSNKLHAFVEYESIELAEKAVMELNKEGSWRNGLRVRLLRRPVKAAQARGKKSGQEEEAAQKEDDTSTSDQQVEDTNQQSDVQSHEQIIVEDQANEKEGGHKKGRNRGRGKGQGQGQGQGRGRSQYNNHHNNRMAHVVAPVLGNSVNTPEHGGGGGKQPPGPRMPDGTRGFAMGRGKPLVISVSD